MNFEGHNSIRNRYALTKTEMGATEKAALVGRVGGADEPVLVLLTPNPAVLLAENMSLAHFPSLADSLDRKGRAGMAGS